MKTEFNPALDLIFERIVDVPPEFLWRGWTDPELVTQWFTPAPWTTASCEIELRPGGKFRTVMVGPDGESHDKSGCYLEIVEGERLVWTSALGQDYRPIIIPEGGFNVTCEIEFNPVSEGARYRATLRHADEQSRNQHDEMGFEDGWGKALDQLIALYHA
jgi:uncharacterized protein YndB with AHSA1/START domain